MFDSSITQPGEAVQGTLLLKAPAAVEKRRLEKHIVKLVKEVGRATYEPGPRVLGIGVNKRGGWRIIVRKGYVEVHTDKITRYALNIRFDTIVQMHRRAWAKVKAQERSRFLKDLGKELKLMPGTISLGTYPGVGVSICVGGNGRVVITPGVERVVMGEYRSPFDVTGKGWAKQYRFSLPLADLQQYMTEVIGG